MKSVGRKQSDKAGIGLNLWQKATVFLALMSWFTTEQGFQNTVFVGENSVWSMFASFAIQTILLAGVLYGAHILERFGKLQKGLCLSIWLLVAGVSITFSYISISNSMYYLDFAVDGNQVTEKKLREIVQSIEQNNLEKLEEIRPNLVESLRKKGYDVMNTDIQTKAKNYVDVTSDYQKLEKEEYLAEIEEIYLTKMERKKFENNPRLKVTGEYVRQAYPETYKNKATNKEFWKRRVAETINSLNHAGYRQYENVYDQGLAIIKNYNKLRNKININNKNDFPTLDQMKALENACKRLIDSITKARANVKNFEIVDKSYADKSKGKYSIITANKYVEKACTVFDELSASVKDLQKTVNELIKHSYGEGNKSVDEILALIGNSNADITELDKARKQMLEAQGSILKGVGNNPSGNLVTEVNDLMSNLNNYVDRVNYHHEISVFKKECLDCTYNIVKTDADIRDKNIGETLSGSSATGQSVSGQSVTLQAISGSAVKALSANEKVIDVTPELWTSNRKIHMSRLNALIFDYPISENDNFKKSLEEFGDLIHRQEKAFLDTSESVKAYNLLCGDREYFPNKGKARLALAFAAFLDLGAALVGVLIYLVKQRKGN